MKPVFKLRSLQNLNTSETSICSRLLKRLRNCSSANAWSHGRAAHAPAIKTGCDQYLANHLLNVYCKSRMADDARHVFDGMQLRNCFSWNTIIAMYAQIGDLKQALELFDEIPERNAFTWNALMEGFVRLGLLEDARHVFDEMPQRNQFSWNAMVAGYAKRGKMEQARQMFEIMPSRNVVSWNSLIAGYAKHGPVLEAFNVVLQMLREGFRLDQYSLGSLIGACSSLPDVNLGKQFHAFVVKSGFQSQAFVESALLDMYAKSGFANDACQVFEGLSQRDVVSWTAMVFGYALCGDMDAASKVFDQMPERNLFSWNALLSGFCQNGLAEEALRFWCRMRNLGLIMDSTNIAAVLCACATLASYKQGIQVHGSAVKIGLSEDIFVGSALIDMYGKCGCPDEAGKHFRDMKIRDVISWNSVITAYAQNGHGQEALAFFSSMLDAGLNPTGATFVGVLTGCNHAGLVAEGCKVFDSMVKVFSVEPALDHYSCMIDMLGKAGHISQAWDLIKSIPFECNAKIWGAFLGACRIHRNTTFGKLAAEQLFKLEPENVGPYLLLSHIYSDAGMLEEALKIRKLMEDRGIAATLDTDG